MINYPASTRFLVLGLGLSGQACVRFLKHLGYTVSANDSRAAFALTDIDSQVHISWDGFDPDLLKQTDVLVVSPGIDLRDPMVQQAYQYDLPVIGEIELFAQAVTQPVIGITGSNGKSTVTTLVGELLSAAGYRVAVGGNLGTPALTLLSQSMDSEAPDIFVLELSSFQLDTTNSLSLAVASVLNVSKDHQDRYASYDDYVASKASIFAHAAVAVINLDDKAVTDMPLPAQAEVIGFSLQPQHRVSRCWVINDHQLVNPDTAELIPVSTVKILGQHNLANVLAALAIVSSYQVSTATAADVLAHFGGLDHRVQIVAEHNNVTWINDSKATNVGATLAAIRGLQQSVILLAGGVGKGADFTPLRCVADRVKQALLFGQDARRMDQVLGDVMRTQQVADLHQAVQLAAAQAQAGDIVLLSPACASLDQYPNYQARGEYFVQQVHEVIAA